MKSVKVNSRGVISKECFDDLLENMLEFEDFSRLSESPSYSHLIAYSEDFEMSLYATVVVFEGGLEISGLYATHDGVDFGVSHNHVSAFQDRFNEINYLHLVRYFEEVGSPLYVTGYDAY